MTKASDARIKLSHPRIEQYLQHKQKWKDCTLCSLSETRFRTVLWKGTLPCDILFIGEAPGSSEDVVGKPFVGPSGKLLGEMLLASCTVVNTTFSYAITNIVACYPGRNNNGDFNRPSQDQALACRPRLEEIIDLGKPTTIVTLGFTSRDMIPTTTGINIRNLKHPASILRKPSSLQESERTRFIRDLVEIIREL